MRRPLTLVVTAILGAVLGAVGTATIQDAGGTVDAGRAATTLPAVGSDGSGSPAPAGPEQLLLAWTPGGLPADLAAAAAAGPGVRAAVTIRGGPVALAAVADDEGMAVATGGGATDDGWVVALDAIAVDPAAYAAVVAPADRPVIAGLRPGEVVLGETSARIRRIGPGATIHLADGHALTVAAIVPDDAVGGAELAVDVATGEAIGVTVPRALVVVHEGDRAAVEAALATHLPPATPVRFRAPGETPFLRAGDAVLPPAAIKDAFGELAYRVPDPGSRDVELDPAWVEANIVTATVPTLGTVRCHRAILPALVGALTELSQKNLAGTVVSFDGCWVPRLVGPGLPLSRHAWGVAIDLNYAANATGTGSTQDPRLVEVMERWGFTWGGRWLEPDPAHFEYVRPAR